MLYSQTPAAEKRRILRERLAAGDPQAERCVRLIARSLSLRTTSVCWITSNPTWCMYWPMAAFRQPAGQNWRWSLKRTAMPITTMARRRNQP